MRCIICDGNNWENVDQFRLKKGGMAICTTCGFVSYPDKYKSEDEIKAYYRTNYRQPPNANNLYTGQKKLSYHEAFLGDVFKEWKDKGKKAPIVADIGAAYGIYLFWVKQFGYKGSEVHGTEWALSYRRNAYHEFGIELSEDFDETKKYDLISSYKVAEHQLDADKYLIKYKECLTEDGYLYVSVPTWFEYLYNFGTNSMDLEYYYHPDHINVWTRKLFEVLLKKCGLEIVKHNGTFYDDTYLCKRNDALMAENIDSARKVEKPEEIKLIMEKLKMAWMASHEGDYQKCVTIWPASPLSYRGLYEKNRAQAHRQGFDFIKKTYLDPAMEACPRIADTLLFCAEVHMRYNKFLEALALLDKAMTMKPRSSMIINMKAQCFRQMASKATNEKDRIDLLLNARNEARLILQANDQGRDEARNWVYADNSNIPMPSEVDKA